VTGKITYKDEKDGLTYEWDEGKKAWFPALGEDFMAMYQLNYGFTKYVLSPYLFRQCCGSGSGLDPDSMGFLDPYHLIFLSAGCSFLRAEGFSCSLDISKLQLLINKNLKNFCCIFFFFQFLVMKTLDPDQDSLEMRDPYPDPDSMNLDPQLCL
jgi:hypothetical protein